MERLPNKAMSNAWRADLEESVNLLCGDAYWMGFGHGLELNPSVPSYCRCPGRCEEHDDYGGAPVDRQVMINGLARVVDKTFKALNGAIECIESMQPTAVDDFEPDWENMPASPEWEETLPPDEARF